MTYLYTFDSCIKALALVYYFRLNQTLRTDYSLAISKIFADTKLYRWDNYDFSSVVGWQLTKFCKLFIIPPGIALNQALKENLFMLFLSIVTKTPLQLFFTHSM